MNFKPTIAVPGMGLLALTMIALLAADARAAGCDSCHYRPGKCPTLTNEGSFGYTPTVWQLWPGPLDPNTSYPAGLSGPATKPPADPDTPAVLPPLPKPGGKLPSKPAAPSASVPANDKAAATSPVPVSTYQVVPGH
jgi:hypothetical protein